MEVGTPVTNKYYLAYSFGEMYGLAQSQSRFSPQAVACLRPDTDVPGLFLAGRPVCSGVVCSSFSSCACWKVYNKALI